MRPTASMVVMMAGILGSLLSLHAGAQGRGQQGPLPDGPGREMVQGTCAQCHGLHLITGSFGYTKEGWEDRLTTMLTLPPEQLTSITTYLATHFPPRPAPAAVMIAGPVHVTITEWMAPTLGSRPHDPLAAADGSIWWTGQFANRLGRVDPRSGALQEYPLQTPESGPHGLVEDHAGNIWFTAISKNYIGKRDATTGAMTAYPTAMTDPHARGPHTPIFDHQGTLWFTMQSGHVGRLSTATGAMQIVAAPSGAGNTYPYGIQVNSQGVPWYVDFRGNRIARIEPRTMAITEITLPSADARPRRLAITADDAVWYTDFARGALGRYDPQNGAIREWLSPGGTDSQPYGIAAVGPVVWYSESGVRPNTLVRFDPASEKFQTWTIPSGGGVIRNMMAMRNGNLVLACSGVNRVALVEVRPKGSPQTH